MIRPSTPPILSELQEASSAASQVKALKELKNELIGHEHKKELWIQLGVLTVLARILNSSSKGGKLKTREVDSVKPDWNQNVAQSDEEEVQLQAIIVVGSLAYGGPSFVAPIYAANIIASLLDRLSLTDHQHQTVFHALKTLDTIADSIWLSSPEQEAVKQSLTSLLYSQQNLPKVSEILRQASANPFAQQEVALAASLISKTCRKNHQRVVAAQTGILEALAVTAAPLILDTVRSPPHTRAKTLLGSILDAVNTVIGGSRSRAIQFLNAPALDLGFSKLGLKHRRDGHISNSIGSNASDIYRRSLKNIESLLPEIPNTQFRNIPKSQMGYPAMGRIGNSDTSIREIHGLDTAVEAVQTQAPEYGGAEESPLIPLLVHIFRHFDCSISLAAAGLLVMFHRLGLSKRPKDSVFALLLVPPLVRMLDESKSPSPQSRNSSKFSLRTIEEEASVTLAVLMNGCLETQSAAFDAGAIKKLSQLLKKSFDPLPTSQSAQSWSPEFTDSVQPQSGKDAHRLGPTGISVTTYHTLRLREAVLTALSAIASEKDEYRKAVIETGVVQFVVKSLTAELVEMDTPYSDGFHAESHSFESTSIHRDVVLAACGTARALSRSVGTLRTSLMDAGLPIPLFTLLKSQNMEFKIAATGVLCNLVLRFSPMREAILADGVLKVLCAHAHSMNNQLRLNSMWALKNLIAGACNLTKMSCLEELGPGWLKQLVADDGENLASFMSSRFVDRDDENSTLMRMSTPNAAGEQVNLLNAVDEVEQNSSQSLEDNETEDMEMSDSIGSLGRGDRSTRYESATTKASGAPMGFPTTDTIVNLYVSRSMSDELAIQKEGLEFIRNLICGQQSPEMIDHLFREFGQDKVFELVTSKLRPKVLNAFSRERRSSELNLRQIYPHPEILISACFILVHIAGGEPRHRQLIASQTEILKLLLPLFNHSCAEVRQCICWIIINVTWVEDSIDKQNARLRAHEFQHLGFLEKLDALDRDESLDCRERAKNARDQMRQLVHA